MTDKELIKNKEMDFLLEISSVLRVETERKRIVSKLNDVFKNYFGLRNIRFMVWDTNASKLRDFAHDWLVIDCGEEQDNLSKILNAFTSGNRDEFFFNGECYHFKLSNMDLDRIVASLSIDKNFLHFPLLSGVETFGIIELEFDSLNKVDNLDIKFFDLVILSLMQISSVILSHILKEQMETSLNFYDAMKNIAKIIESQYELNYIIPLIGEMIDRFISAHLIYIFIKNKDNKYELLWPKACKDKEIGDLLNKITLSTDSILSENKKIGVFPLISENTILGAIVAYSNIDKLLDKEIDYLVQLSKQAGTTIQRANVYAEILQHATMDALTGLNNRRQFELRLNQEIATTKRKNTPLCCMMLDVDYFKKVNDTYGHTAGDCVLKNVSKLITTALREYDIASRYGGEEFFIILPQTNIEEASFVAQRLRRTIEEAKIDITEAKVPNINFIKVTVSIGLSDYEGGESAQDFYQNADRALYDAKHRGRNKVVVYNRQSECSI